MSPADADAGDPGRPVSIPRRLVFIDETWIKTTWPRCAAGDRKASATLDDQ